MSARLKRKLSNTWFRQAGVSEGWLRQQVTRVCFRLTAAAAISVLVQMPVELLDASSGVWVACEAQLGDISISNRHRSEVWIDYRVQRGPLHRSALVCTRWSESRYKCRSLNAPWELWNIRWEAGNSVGISLVTADSHWGREGKHLSLVETFGRAAVS